MQDRNKKLEENIRSRSDYELNEILNARSNEYTELALAIAKDEIYRREHNILPSDDDFVFESVTEPPVDRNCANCNAMHTIRGEEKLGHLFLSTRVKTERSPGTMLKNSSTTYRHAGFRIKWFICDACARKGHDKSVLLTLGAVIFFSYVVLEYDSDFFWGLLIALFFFFPSLGYWLKGREYRSRYARDNVLSKSIYKLLGRDDFLSKYGHVELSKEGLDQTMTRFQLDEDQQ